MHGFSLALPSPFGGKASLPRSASSPTLPQFSRPQCNRRSSISLPNDLPRSASFPVLPNFDWNVDTEEESKFEEKSKSDSSTQLTENTDNGLVDIEQEQAHLVKHEIQGQKRISFVAGPKLWIKKVKGQLAEQQIIEEVVGKKLDSSSCGNALPKSGREILPKAMSKSLATIARKSWNTPKTTLNLTEDKALTKINVTCEAVTENSVSSTSNTVDSPSKYSLDPLQKLPKMTFHQIFESPSSTFVRSSILNSANSSTSSFNESTPDNQSTPRTSTDKVQDLPNDTSAEKNGQISVEGFIKRDELQSAFRALENHYAKFQSKCWSLKMNVVRSSLIPFLRSHSGNASAVNLRPEDLDRRVNVLNKWWTGLLDMLDGKHSQNVSGVDRPVLLQGCFDIMIRPEWRYSFSVPTLNEIGKPPICSVTRRTLLPKRCAESPASATHLPYMVESISQNIRQLYIHNLSLQMNFAVEKMSLRCAPASLVAFCGKAVAYAFFFVPGIAEILVRIWKLQPDILRRVSDELDVPRGVSNVEMDDIAACFPAHLHRLAWSSAKSMSNFLRKTPNIPEMLHKAAWYGPWVARWCGRDSDLFFIFVKHYCILSESLFPPDFSLRERARSPGYLLVLAQTLLVIDGTIHRQPAADPLPISFDDVLAGAEASATSLPLPSNNSIRLMAENRLITLLRDFLYDRPSENEKARMTFGQLFGKMMQAAAKKTSLFDHSACFILCDFMEEALNVFMPFHEENKFIDWYFWFDVCKKILQSENSMSEIRLFAFLYGVWDIVTADDRRKEIICLDWLLTEDFFDKYFNHWCPMIRAYYMRLLCWRVCRNNGEFNDLDLKIFNTVLIRIRSNWEYYLYLKVQAETSNSFPPSTSPCLPAPGRRLLIIRNDNPPPSAPLYVGLEGFVSRSSCRNLAKISTTHRHSLLSPISTNESNSFVDPIVEPNKQKSLDEPQFLGVNYVKKRWTFLGKVFLSPFFDSSSATCSDESTNIPLTIRSGLADRDKFHVSEERKKIKCSKSQTSASSSENEKSGEAQITHRPFTFRFSLEFGPQFEQGISSSVGSASSVNNVPPISTFGTTTLTHGLGERRLSPPRLPAPAQALLTAKLPGVSREIASKDWLPANTCNESHSDAASHILTGCPSDKSYSASPAALREEIPFLLQFKIGNNIITINKKENFMNTAIYKGRALAEWAIVVGECNGFLERRRNEGVPNLKMVEVPMLGVEGFRRYG